MNQEEPEQIMSHPMFPMTRQAFMDSRNRLDYLSYVHSGLPEIELAESERLYHNPMSRRHTLQEAMEKTYGKQTKCPCCGANLAGK